MTTQFSSLIKEEEVTPTAVVPVAQQLILLTAILTLLLGGAVLPRLHTMFNTDEDTEIINESSFTTASLVDKSEPPTTFADLNLAAESVFVWDVHNQRILYSTNPDEQLPIASITKLMTALVAAKILTNDANVAIDNEALDQYGTSGLFENELFTKQALTDLMLLTSSNDGAYALASAAGQSLDKKDSANTFVKAMNIEAVELGLTNTYFINPTGLDIDAVQAGAFGSARDINFLMEHLILNEPDVLALTTELAAEVTSGSGFSHIARNTNQWVGTVPGLLGSKTGYTDLAGGNLVVALDAGLNRPVIITVLGSTRQERFTDVRKLIDATLYNINEAKN